jgi:hypothetical protein
MATDRPGDGNTLPPQDKHPVSWVSLFRTARAPLAVLVLSAIGLIIPPQTADMLATLSNGGFHFWPAFWFQVSLAFLSTSAWYWARTLIDARFDVVGTKADRARLVRKDTRIDSFALAAVPWSIVLLSVALGLSLILQTGHILPNVGLLAAWVIVFVGLAAFSWAHPPATQEQQLAERSTSNVCEWVHHVRVRLGLLAKRAPGPSWLTFVIVAVAILFFIVGAVASFVDWEGMSQISLPTRIATIFPGPSAALICLGLMIGPLSVLTFLFDGLRLSWTVKGHRIGPSRPPIILVLVLWVIAAPYVFSLHTVRVMPSKLVGDRKEMGEFFKAWASACAPANGPLRPIIVAVSGGASRAAVWGASVLEKVEAASPTGQGPTVFAVSSVSGGSLGVAAYLALLNDLPPAQRCTGGSTDARKTQAAVLGQVPLAHDALGPLLAAAIVVDIPRSLLSLPAFVVRVISGEQPRGGDRAEWLEHAFEGIWKEARNGNGTLFDKPFLSLFYDESGQIKPGMPIWLANGTEVGSGSRVLTVPFKPQQDWPFYAAKDALAALNADVSISTAINNTARFPYLEPSGELLAYRDPKQPAKRGEQFRIVRDAPGNTDDARKTDDTRELIDGGYFENEGLQTALELAQWLRTKGRAFVANRAVEPIIVQATADGDAKVDNKDVVRCGLGGTDDPSKGSGMKRSLQLLAPVFGLYNVRGGHSAIVLRAAKADYCDNAFFHFYLPGFTANPGSVDKTDVPLNWLLSDGTTARVRDAITEDAGNASEGGKLVKALAP